MTRFGYVMMTYFAGLGAGCQTAPKGDPGSASKRDPVFWARTAGSVRPGVAGLGCAAGADAVALGAVF